MVLSLAPETKILATSREPLHISGEYVRQVPPLTIDDGVALFQQRARQSGSENAGGSASSTSIRKIVERLDGVPLAIELAAARTSIMDADQILAGLDSRFDLLTGGMRDASVQHRSLRASVAWSYDLMTAEEQALARRLCVLRGFMIDTATALGAADESGKTDVLNLLQRLVDMSIVQVDRSGKNTRFRFLETVREFLL